MEKVTTLLERVTRNYNPDFWAEVELPSVAELLDQLDEHGWKGLSQEWPSLSPQGQIQLVQACRACRHPMRMRMLEAIVQTPDAHVGAAVAQALLEHDYAWNPEISIRAEFERHKENLEGHELRLVERMILRLPR